MSNPRTAIIAGFAFKEAAMALWAQLDNNDAFAVVGVNIGLASMNPAKEEVCWIILPITALDNETSRSADLGRKST